MIWVIVVEISTGMYLANLSEWHKDRAHARIWQSPPYWIVTHDGGATWRDDERVYKDLSTGMPVAYTEEMR